MIIRSIYSGQFLLSSPLMIAMSLASVFGVCAAFQTELYSRPFEPLKTEALSKAPSMSSNIASVIFFFLKPFSMCATSSLVASMVDLFFMKPNWCLLIHWFFVAIHLNLEFRILSNIFPMTGRRLIGL